MTEETSVLTFERVNENGYLKGVKEKAAQAYYHLFNLLKEGDKPEGITANELQDYVRNAMPEVASYFPEINHMNKVDSMLVLQGVIKYIGNRECKVKKTMAKAYVPTGKEAIELPKTVGDRTKLLNIQSILDNVGNLGKVKTLESISNVLVA